MHEISSGQEKIVRSACICFGIRFKLLSWLHANTGMKANAGLVFLVSSDHWDGREAWTLPVRLPILGMSLSSMDGGG